MAGQMKTIAASATYDNDGKVFIAACESQSGGQRFDSWPGQRRTTTLEASNSCVALEDGTPSAGAAITMLPCDSEPRPTWRYHYVSCEPTFGWYTRLCNDQGCVKGFNAGSSGISNRAKLVDEPFADWWDFDSDAFDAACFGTGLLRLLRNPSLCLQRESDADDAPVRVYRCDCNNYLQQFGCGFGK